MIAFKTTLAAAAIALAAGSAFAATVSVSVNPTVNPVGDMATLTAGWKSVTQDFEDLGKTRGEKEVGPSLATNVGTFTSLGGKGTGGTVTGLPGNKGTELTLRDEDVFGRKNVAPTDGAWFLDSNDTWGISWNVALEGGQKFNKLIFALTDATDMGAYLRVSVGGIVQTVISGLSNAETKLVVIDFGDWVSSATIDLGNFTKSTKGKYKKDDGFSLDGIEVSIAAVPLPAGMLLLGSALAGFGVVARRRKTA